MLHTITMDALKHRSRKINISYRRHRSEFDVRRSRSYSNLRHCPFIIVMTLVNATLSSTSFSEIYVVFTPAHSSFKLHVNEKHKEMQVMYCLQCEQDENNKKSLILVVAREEAKLFVYYIIFCQMRAIPVQAMSPLPPLNYFGSNNMHARDATSTTVTRQYLLHGVDASPRFLP